MEQVIDLVEPQQSASPLGDGAVAGLSAGLQAIRKAMRAAESRLLAEQPDASAAQRNLTHYLALCRHDPGRLQEQLARLGLSLPARAEARMLEHLDRLQSLLDGPCGRGAQRLAASQPALWRDPTARRRPGAGALFGPAPAMRGSPVMVTLPAEAAANATLIPSLVHAGMDVARIDCADDDAETWIALASRVREAAAAAGRPVRVLMQLAGPRLLTGPVEPGPRVLKLKPQRDAYGVTTTPAQLLLRPRCRMADDVLAGATLELDAQWLSQLRPGERIHLVDARGRKRWLQVVELLAQGALVQTERSVHFQPGTRLVAKARGAAPSAAEVRELPARPGRLHLKLGQTLRLCADGLGHDARPDAAGGRAVPASIACNRPQLLARLREGQRIWFDDGRIGGIVHRTTRQRAEIEITEAGADGEFLYAGERIRLPDSELEQPALTDQDIANLPLLVRHADLVGLSCVQSAADVQALRERLAALCAGHLGIVLGLETRRGFQDLPALLLAALSGPATAVMIARRDLALECGVEHLAGAQEEILRLCTAAHMPLVWAPAALQQMARSGRASRAEIADAATAVQADCLMLDKGPHVLQALRRLDEVLRLLQQPPPAKKRTLRPVAAHLVPGWAAGPEPRHRPRTAGPQSG